MLTTLWTGRQFAWGERDSSQWPRRGSSDLRDHAPRYHPHVRRPGSPGACRRADHRATGRSLCHV